MQNEEGQNVDLYIPRKCSATNRLITSKDHASVQLNIGHLDEAGRYTGQFSTFALSGFVRAQGDADSALDRLWQKKIPILHSVLSQFTRKNKAHGCLDLPRSDGGLLVVPRELGGLLSELLEDVIDEAVHDPHSLAEDPDVRVDLFQHLEDIDLIGLDALLDPLLLLVVGGGSSFLWQLLPSLRLLLRQSLLSYDHTLGDDWLTLADTLRELNRMLASDTNPNPNPNPDPVHYQMESLIKMLENANTESV
ncbi:hypothetical protein F0562_019937 [Nyssa sinensis]|uniref:40S ribosomal protein S21 n=1 Tax=Nyssa sinensis TaxID=561372 RepID=A0A5J5BR77_9ASTE|nr:hypothetical protein F0562_019937 [Nyssa sinensis]